MGRKRKKQLPTEPVRVTIESLSHDGRGICHVDGKTVFVHGALPGEEVDFLYTRIQKKHDEGKTLNVITPSADRAEAQCAQFDLCGGCALQHQKPSAQIDAKQQALMNAFERIGKVTPERILPPLSSGTSWGYRRKARLGVKYVEKKGKVLVGFRERGSGFLADISECHVLHPSVGTLITPLSQLIDSLSIREQIPQIEVAIGDQTSILIFRVLTTPDQSDREKLLAFGRSHHHTIYLQEAGPDSVTPLNGEPAELSYRLPEHDIEVRFLPGDFTQVNSELNRLMVDHALDLLQIGQQERVLDLFCGLGNFTLPMARQAAEVVGVEGDAGLVRRARENAHDNGIANTRYFTANLYAALDREPWLMERYSKALLDPPRSGAIEVLEHLPRMGIERIVYVSCYPGTLARDAGELVHKHGYTLKAAGVMDMFPHTAHVESIALFDLR